MQSQKGRAACFGEIACMHSFFRYLGKTLLFILWVSMSICLGGIAVSVKETLGINVFSTTGYSALKQCLVQESNKAVNEASQRNSAN